MHNHERAMGGAQDVDGVVDLFQRTHARGDEGQLALGGDGVDQVVMGQHGRGDLVIGQVVAGQELLAGQVPGRREPGHAHLAAIGVDGVIFRLAEFQAFLLGALGITPRTLARLVEDVGRIDDVDGALLELHGVKAGLIGRLDQGLGDIEVTIVVDADLGDQEGAVGGRPRQAGRGLVGQYRVDRVLKRHRSSFPRI
jgi:hypothetical protein